MSRPSHLRLIALLGDPVAHSLSPLFQNAALRALDLPGVFVPLRCSTGDLPGLIRGIARAGGAGNVTVPHKELAAAVVERPTEDVVETGACNAFWLDDDGRIRGDNTDVVGFTRAARELLRTPLRDAEVLVLGAGGAARAVVAALVREGARGVVLVNRTTERARALAARWEDRIHVRVVDSAAELRGERFDLGVNATSCGLGAADELHPLPEDGVRLGAALDLVYSPSITRWAAAWRHAGISAGDGKSMLLHQGAAAFERWWGRPAPIEAMRTALADAASA